jgi:hypothetical protein
MKVTIHHCETCGGTLAPDRYGAPVDLRMCDVCLALLPVVTVAQNGEIVEHSGPVYCGMLHGGGRGECGLLHGHEGPCVVEPGTLWGRAPGC